ncbi:flagellar hook-associated protein FlgK [Pengzhenrongella sicca]|uniref:Flagellar hook-associated protein 1 n=1 Tax=Pengzhenrongella sicca TaxID=2819238 RepID=A0A8A4ZCZ3_9MICO|nr:flagellar hook-associated protein FlgK [Pengzhenrongella sicca]QTE29850.1 flagellar hook-associated protein FlgK [Pengzhenrongella sicca]
MSTFSGMSTALSSLIAQRQALEVSGQNIANANTVGYTRQRASLTSVESLTVPSLFSTGLAAGNGTKVTSIDRLGNIFLDARLRAETGGASFAATKAAAYANLESTVAEPGDNGVSAALQEFWAGWETVGLNPGTDAARTVLLEKGTALASRITAGFAAVSTQWTQTRTELDAAVVDVNATATAVADLNDSIRGVIASGSSANELIDQRNVLVTELSALVGATGIERPDGTVDVMVGGNALVRGGKTQAIAASPSYTMGSSVTLSWAASGAALSADSGSVVGMISVLAPADATTKNGGLLAEAAARYDELAIKLTTSVNEMHQASYTAAGAEGGAFFASTGAHAAQSLTVAITDVKDIAVASETGGALDGSRADEMAAIGKETDGPDSIWTAFVADLGVKSRSATQRAVITESTRSTAEGLQLSSASVDVDEEAVNMLAYQRAYEGAARVLTAIDEMLDTLINRTAV